jgi:hypothetical protein
LSRDRANRRAPYRRNGRHDLTADQVAVVGQVEVAAVVDVQSR